MPQHRRCQRRRIDLIAFVLVRDKGCELAHVALVGIADVSVGCRGGFEAEADMLAAARDAGPIEEFKGRVLS